MFEPWSKRAKLAPLVACNTTLWRSLNRGRHLQLPLAAAWLGLGGDRCHCRSGQKSILIIFFLASLAVLWLVLESLRNG